MFKMLVRLLYSPYYATFVFMVSMFFVYDIIDNYKNRYVEFENIIEIIKYGGFIAFLILYPIAYYKYHRKKHQ